MIPTPDIVDLVLYHASCFDGFTAAWVAWLCRGGSVEYVPVFHGEPPPDVTGRHVAIFDFAYKRPVLEAMAAEAATLIVVDHHKSAQEDLTGLEYAIFDMDRSGARLAYDWWFGEYSPVYEETDARRAMSEKIYGCHELRLSDIERLCNYIQDRDLWQWKLWKSHQINEAIKVVPFEFSAWTQFARELSDADDEVAERGEALLAMTKQHLSLLAKSAAIARLDEHVVWVANAPYIYASELGSLLCTRGDEGIFDALRISMGPYGETVEFPSVAAIWRYDHAKQRISWSLRSAETSDIDVSKIAVAHGGGGHFHAAGFEVETSDPLDVIRKL